MSKVKVRPVHPGEILLEEFLKPMGLSQKRCLLLGSGSRYESLITYKASLAKG
jgi:plasmid maintenance system antidote protein VapI